MSLGLAIFLSTLVVSTVLLYRWGYLRKFARGVFALFVIVVLIGGTWFGYRAYESQPTPQTSYQNLSLGMGMEEVIYIKGVPNDVYSVEDPEREGWQEVIPVDELDKQEKRKDIKDYYDWAFHEETGSRVDVSFSPTSQKLVEITCHANSDDLARCGVLGIFTGASEEDVIDALGKPEHERIEGVTKTMEYPSLNLRMNLVKRKVYRLTVRSPDRRASR